MRTYIGTTVTLDTVFRIPYRNVNCNTTFFVCRCSGWCSTIYVCIECRYRQVISFLSRYCRLDVVNEVNSIFSSACSFDYGQTFIFCIFPAFRNLNFNNLFCTFIDSSPVLSNYIVTFTSVCSFSSSFHQVNRLFFRNDCSQFEECGLQDCIDTGWSHTGFDTDFNTINYIELDVVVSDKCFYLTWQMFFQTFHIPWAVQQECTTVNQFLNHVIFVNIGRIVAGNKVSFTDQVCGFDRFLTKTQVGHCYTTGFFGVIIKVCLSVHISVVTDDLDGVLVSTYSTVCSQTPELTVDSSFRSSNDRSTCFQRQIGNIIYDTNSKFLFGCVFVNSYDLCRCGVFGSQTITTGKDWCIVELGSFQSCNNVQIQRLAHSTRLFCSVKNCDLFYSLRNSIDQGLCTEWSVQTNFYNTDFFACCCQVIDGFFDGIIYRTHSYDYVFCIFSTIVVEQFVVCSDFLVNFVHVFLYDSRHSIIVRVTCFSCLEEDIRVLS